MGTAEVNSLSAFKTRDAASYDSVTRAFDHFTQRFTATLARGMIHLARLRPGEQVLDVGTGTGIVPLAAGHKVAPGGRVLGVDLSEGMLRAATIRAGSAGLLDCVGFRRMDAEALDLPDRSFDVVLSLFALRHFPVPGKALSEMFRVLRPGGRLVVAIASGPPLTSWAAVKRIAGRVADGLLLRPRLVAPNFLVGLLDRHCPAPEETEVTAWSRRRTNLRRLVCRMAQDAGFEAVRGHWAGGEAELRTPEEFWELQVTFSSVGRKRLADVGESLVGTIRDEFMTTCRRALDRGGRLVYPYGAFSVCGQKPNNTGRTTGR